MSIDVEDLEQVNEIWNRAIRYVDYSGENRGIEEAIRHGGKCHDYVEAKGFGLKQRGIASDQLSVGIGVTTDGEAEAHSVLICDGWVLDNRRTEIYRQDEAEEAGEVRITDVLAYDLFFS